MTTLPAPIREVSLAAGPDVTLSSATMPEGPFAAKQRDLVNTARALCAERAAAESAIDDEHARASTDARRRADQTIAAAEAHAAQSKADALAAFAEASARIEGDARAAIEGAQKAGATAATIARERAESDEAASRKRRQDSLWMAETLYDSNKDKPRFTFEQTDGVIRAQELRLTQVGGAGSALARRYGVAWPTPHAAAPEPNAAAPTDSPADLLATLKTHAERAQTLGLELDRLFLGRIAVGAGPWLLIIAGTAAGGAGLPLAMNAWRATLLAGGAVAGALLASAIVLALRAALRGRASALVAELTAALHTAQTAGAHTRAAAAALRAQQEQAIREARDTEAARAKDLHQQTMLQLKEQYQRRSSELKHTAQSAVANLIAERDAALAALAAHRDAALAQAESTRDRLVTQAEHDRDRALEEADAARDRAWSAMAQRWRDGVMSVYAQSDAQQALSVALAPPWTADADTAWTPRTEAPVVVTIAHSRVELAALPGGLPTDPRLTVAGPGREPALTLPVALELPDRASLLIQHAGPDGRPLCLATLQNAMLRLLTTIPPGKLRFTLLDPVGLGQSFAAFMHLADYEPLLVADRIWTEPRHIEQKLTDLTEHMENVIQKYLRNQFASIEHYNQDAGEIAEPYRFLVIADFPNGFNEASAKRLASIVASGPRCGVYTLIAHDTRGVIPAGLAAADIEKAASLRLTHRKSADGSAAMSREDPDLGAFPLTPEAPPADAVFNRLVHRVGAASKDAGRVQVPFTTITPRPPELWSRDSGKDVHVAMGRAGATRLQSLTLGRGTAQHALIAGRTGSGKSTLLHAIITNLALWYSPAQVEFYLIDFKKGVEFKTYAANRTPHARVVAVESEREFGLSVLRRLDAELKRRGELFRDAGVQDLAGFRAARPGESMPRSLLLVDEFQELFVEDDKLAQEAGLLLDRLVRQGRAFGMHVVLGSQTLGGAYSLARSTIGQMAVRIALQCTEADSYLILSDDNAAARLLTRPGEAIYNDQSGAIAGNSPFQVAWLPDQQRDELLETLKIEAERRGLLPAEPMIVFEGNAPADLSANHLLRAAQRGQPPAFPTVWLGEPIAIKEPTAAVFRRQSGANLLVVGQREDAALASSIAAITALAAQLAPDDTGGPAPITILDGTPADAPTAGTLERLAGRFPGHARSVAYRDVAAAVESLLAELDRRQQADAAGTGAANPPRFLLIHGLHRYRMLRRPENEFDFSGSGDSAATPDKLFARLLREGPSLGMHVICWCDTVANLSRTLDRQSQREFDLRVLFQMSQADSASLIDSPTAGLIGQNRALFASEEQGLIEKFRPYAMTEEM